MPPRPERVFWRPECPDCAVKMKLVRREFQHRDDGMQMLLHCRCETCGRELASELEDA